MIVSFSRKPGNMARRIKIISSLIKIVFVRFKESNNHAAGSMYFYTMAFVDYPWSNESFQYFPYEPLR